MNQSISKSNYFASGILGIILIMNFVVGFINEYIEIQNLFPILIAFLGALLVAYNLIKKKLKAQINIGIFGVVCMFAVQLIFSALLINRPITIYYIQCFGCVAIPCMYIGSADIDLRIVRHTSLIAALMCCTYYCTLLTKEYTVYNSAEQMGTAYSLVPIICISCWTIMHTRDRWGWKLIAIVHVCACIMLFVRFMTRGAWACIFVFFVICVLTWKKKRSVKIVAIAAGPIIAVMVYYLLISCFVNTDLYQLLFVAKSDDFFNGRTDLYLKAFSYRGVIPSLLGSGIGAFYTENRQTYPHNLFGQLYYDQGLVVMLYIIVIIACAMILFWKYNKENKQDAYLLLLLLCASILRLMVSYYFWIDQLFWVFLSYVTKEYYIKRKVSVKK